MAEKKKTYVALSVHDLVDFLLRQGDIDDRVYNQETMQMGTLVHSRYQKEQGLSYISEYALAETFERPSGVIMLNGRADGIIIGGKYPIIDEIKSTVAPLGVFAREQEAWHRGQAECYALMYCHEKKIDKIGVRLTYIHQVTGDKMVEDYTYSLEELEAKVHGYMDEYFAFHELHFAHLEKRDESAKTLEFPFDGFRPGQRELSKYAYGIAKKGGVLFAEAPTGIGKTMSTLYPSIKAFDRSRLEKIFYLTAKNTGANSAYQAMGELYKKGLVAHDSFLLAKDKICFCPGHSCNPDDCPYAKGYYGKIKSVCEEALKEGTRFDDAYVIKVAQKNAMCPFELQLDLSLWSDVIVCDYNYFFDPLVHLQRFFGDMANAKNDVVLIDEAHNLIDRGRSMYSVSISTKALEYARLSIKKSKSQSVKRALKKFEKFFDDLRLSYPDGASDFDEPPSDLKKAVESLKRANQKAAKEGEKVKGQAYKEFFLDCNKYLRLISEFYGSNYKVYLDKKGNDLSINLYCLDPSPFIQDSFDKVKGAIVFSATLSPIDFYMDSITGSHDHPFLLLPSPFPKENFLLMLAPKVSVRYKDRHKSYEEVAEYLKAFVSGKKGNYFIYFPSYEYMDNIIPYLDFGDAEILIQDRNLDNEQRGAFLAQFQERPKKTTIGLVILGGAFSEGIDMYSDRLIGVALIGIGIPQIGHDNDLIRDYHEARSGQGYEFAYMDPGVNKVMQAVGRLIRSETDRGAALLIDDRYMRSEYRDLFARTWSEYEVVTHPEDVKENLKEFYKKKSS
ncbi:MAG: hypothetical protein MJ239_06500 [Bacilli bacterium]|nr:hypothetical protein [Bacilli bacterium]